MVASNIEQRDIERDGFCRGCDEQLKKGTPIVYTYSRRNRGQSIIFCMGCSELIGDLSLIAPLEGELFDDNE